MRVWPGDPAPLGATFDGLGTNLAVFSNVADAVEVCIFDSDGSVECVELPERSGAVFHGYFPDMESGARYGLRVHGPYEPSNGQRCDPSKLLIDPYARAIDGDIDWAPAVFAYDFDDPSQRNQDDSAAFVPKSVVVNPFFDWTGDTALRHQWADTVIYEAHVKGATMTHPNVPEELRGTYAGIADPAFVDHLTALGVTRWSCSPCITSSTSSTCSTVACATTGATTPSATSRPIMRIHRAAPAVTRCTSSNRWSRRCTPPASR